MAAETGGYFGVSAGETDAGLGVSDFDVDGSFTSGKVDDSDTGWKLFGGYRYNENVALEGGLYNLGEVTFDGTSSGGFLLPAGPVSADVEADGFFVAVVGTIPFNKFAIFGQIGLHRWDADVKLTISSGSGSDDEDGTDPMYGIGVEYHASDSIAIRGAFEVFTEILDEDIDLLSISVLINPK